MNDWIWICILICILFFVFIEIYRENHIFRVTRYKISSKKLSNPCKMIFLSDLHNYTYGERNKNLLEAIRKENPDIILIGGDMLIGKDGHQYDVAEQFVSTLVGICPVYYANGNHEQRLKEKPNKYELSYLQYKQSLSTAGVIFLENTTMKLDNVDDDISVTGLEIPLEYYTHFKKKKMIGYTIDEDIGHCNHGFRILLAHNPAYMQEYLDWGADLILSGHLHGGMIRIPGVGGLISPDFTILPKYSGELTNVQDQAVVVSKGLGSHTIKIRLFNPAEIIVLNFENKI